MRPLAAATLVSALVACGGARAPSPPSPSPSPSPRSPASACPDEMAHVGAACVDRWEGALLLVEGDAPFSPYETVKGRSVRAVSRANVVPQGYISQVEAKAACGASGKRLCTEAEWVRACRGPNDTAFPYGATRKAGVCNGESTVAPLAFMPPGQQFPDMTNMNNPRLNQLPNTLAKTGEHAGCTNDYGVFDMVGNLHEWVAEVEFLGGYFRDTSQNGDGCAYKTTAHPDWYHDYSTGFRCCKDAAP